MDKRGYLLLQIKKSEENLCTFKVLRPVKPSAQRMISEVEKKNRATVKTKLSS
jgi:hypothetical protein